MKTAMQELKDKIQYEIEELNGELNEYKAGYKQCLINIQNDIDCECEQEIIKLMQVLELVEVTLQNGNDIKPDSLIIRNAVRQCLGMEVINL
jgi:hypothetical protein